MIEISTIKLQTLWPALLLPLPLLVYWFIPSQKSMSSALRVPFLKRLSEIDQTDSHKSPSQQLTIILLGLIWLLLIIACCRPVQIGEAQALPYNARDMLLAVDISGSMKERDMVIQNKKVQRIIAVKSVLNDFIEQRKGDRLGLILFADNAYMQAPLTHDTNTVRKLLKEAQLGFAGERTAIGDAIGLSVKRLIERPTESRTLILLTDGANNAGNVQPEEASRLAAENDIRIYTIGFGSEMSRQRNLYGSAFGSSFLGNRSQAIDEAMLQSIADKTGGQYFRATSVAELDLIYKELDKLETIEQEEQFFRPTKQLFFWPLSASLFLAALIFVFQIFSEYLTSPIKQLNQTRQTKKDNKNKQQGNLA